MQYRNRLQPPLSSDVVVNGGVYVPRRSLDRWAVPAAGQLAHIAVLGDSIPLAAGVFADPLLYLDGFVQRLQRSLGNAMGGCRGAGFMGVNRSQNAIFSNSAQEWTIAGAWARVASNSNTNLTPYRASVFTFGSATDILTFTPVAVSAARQVADAVTNGTTTVTSATAAFVATDKGQPVYGTGIPKFSCIVLVNSATNITISRAATTSQSGGTLFLGGRNMYPGGIAGVEIVWVDTSVNGAFSYSLNNGGSWTAVASTTPATPTLKRTFVATTLPSGNFKIRAADAAGTAHATIQAGIIIYNTASLPTSGCLVHSITQDGSTLDAAGLSGVPGLLGTGADDQLVLLDPGTNLNNQSLNPVLTIPYVSNDFDLIQNGTITLAQYQADALTVINRVQAYSDILWINSVEQNRPVATPATQASARAAIKATVLANGGAVLDNYDAWAAQGEVGFAAANADGLMLDVLHPSLEGHADFAGHLTRMLATLAV